MYLKSYPEIDQIVDQMFPPIKTAGGKPLLKRGTSEAHNDLNFWKTDDKQE